MRLPSEFVMNAPRISGRELEGRTGRLNIDAALIIRTGAAEYGGIVQYYLLASDVWQAGPARMGRQDLHARHVSA
jgi:hypothetical protein